MASPKTSTVKRLFAVSGNRCAFPRCNNPLVDSASEKVTGRICHIKGRKPGAARYDANQTEEERHAFENLILMCPIHHDVIDSDELSYTVERLTQIKAEHEAKWAGGDEPNNDIVAQLIANLETNISVSGSIILTQHQMGGQVAHSITNVGLQARQVSQTAADVLIAELRKFSPEKAEIVAVLGDSEACTLAEVLIQVLRLAGWEVDGLNQAVFAGTPHGIIIETPRGTQSLVVLLNWLNQVGFQPQGSIVQGSDRTKIVVGTAL